MAKIERIIWSHWPKVMVKLTFSSIRVIQIGPFMNNTKDDPRERGSKTVKSCEKSKNNASDRKKKFREPILAKCTATGFRSRSNEIGLQFIVYNMSSLNFTYFVLTNLYGSQYIGNYCTMWGVVVAQLVDRSLSIPEVCSSNPDFGKIYIEHLFTCLLSTALKRRK